MIARSRWPKADPVSPLVRPVLQPRWVTRESYPSGGPLRPAAGSVDARRTATVMPGQPRGRTAPTDARLRRPCDGRTMSDVGQPSWDGVWTQSWLIAAWWLIDVAGSRSAGRWSRAGAPGAAFEPRCGAYGWSARTGRPPPSRQRYVQRSAWGLWVGRAAALAPTTRSAMPPTAIAAPSPAPVTQTCPATGMDHWHSPTAVMP